MRNFLKTKRLKNKKKLKKTKRNKKTNRTKKTRKFIKMSGGNNNYLPNVFNSSWFRFSTKSEPNTEPEPTPEPTPEPIKVNTINGDSIYRINIKGCDYYFFGNNKRYVLVLIDDKSYIYKLDNDIAELPEDMAAIRKFRETNFVEIKDLEVDWEQTIEELDKKNVLYFQHGRCSTANLNLNKAKDKLSELNESLQDKCSNLSLSLDYVYKHKTGSTLELYHSFNNPGSDGPYSLVLCLYMGNHCISSITINIKKDGKELSIDSKTHGSYIKKKYNTLLRSIIIIISKHISKDLRYIISIANNPDSAYMMMQYFGGKLFNPYGDKLGRLESEFLNFSEKKRMPLYKSDTNYKELFKLYKDEFYMLIIAVEVNPENIEKAYKKFNDLVGGISQITCPDV